MSLNSFKPRYLVSFCFLIFEECFSNHIPDNWMFFLTYSHKYWRFKPITCFCRLQILLQNGSTSQSSFNLNRCKSPSFGFPRFSFCFQKHVLFKKSLVGVKGANFTDNGLFSHIYSSLLSGSGFLNSGRWRMRHVGECTQDYAFICSAW